MIFFLSKHSLWRGEKGLTNSNRDRLKYWIGLYDFMEGGRKNRGIGVLWGKMAFEIFFGRLVLFY